MSSPIAHCGPCNLCGLPVYPAEKGEQTLFHNNCYKGSQPTVVMSSRPVEVINPPPYFAPEDILCKMEAMFFAAFGGSGKLFELVQYSDTKPIALWLDKGADPNVRNKEGETPLHVAVRNQFPEVVELLCIRGAIVQLSGSLGVTIMNNFNLEILAILTKYDVDGYTALHLAADREDLLKCISLLSTKDINAQDSEGNTPLHLALKEKHNELKVCRFLIDAGANVNCANKKGITPFQLSLIYGKLIFLKDFLEHGANVDSSFNGMTPLRLVMGWFSGRWELKLEAKYDQALMPMLDRKPNVKSTDGKMHKDFQQACQLTIQYWNDKKENTDRPFVFFRRMLELGADPNGVDDNGNTALHLFLAESGIDLNDLISVAVLLIKFGINTELKNNEGISASEMIAKNPKLKRALTPKSVSEGYMVKTTEMKAIAK